MKIESVSVQVFTFPTRLIRDAAGHAHASRDQENQARMALLRIRTEDGTEGYAFGPPEVIRSHVINTFARAVLIGQNAFDRERLWRRLNDWQRGSAGQLTDRALSLIDIALWDWAGRKLGLPVHKLLGGYREKVLAYGSTMVGDEQPGGLSTPDDYARFAEQLVARGYKAIKLHTWSPPVPFAPSVSMDIKACAAVREAVGPDIVLMLDSYHWYSRTEALTLGRAIEKLGFAWFEEPMEEESLESYIWLAEHLDIPVVGPEVVYGKFLARATWARSGACDILRAGAPLAGGIGACMKVAHLAESFGMNCEVHGNGAPNLNVIGAIKNCDWYERGLLHPFMDHEVPPAYLNRIVDPMDEHGYVHLPTLPGMGEDINFDHIDRHTIDRY